MLKALAFEACLIVAIIYIPGLNTGLLLTGVPPNIAASGLWMVVVIFLYDETRKYLIR
jgi:ABC-type iron transport system FetAB permease component